MTDTANKYKLAERTALFGENMIRFLKALKQDPISKPLIIQVIRSSTSIGANYMEANGASSRRDFRNKIFICKKESQETQHWLRMLAHCFPEKRDQIRPLWKEVHELTLIFQRITTTLNKPKGSSNEKLTN